MGNRKLSFDPYNLIITGVGGQGNVMASRILGRMLTLKGLVVTIGETFGASQRGGSVMSHLRISASSSFSPQIPKGKAHMVVSLEPTEALRVLKSYGNQRTKVISNTRAIHPVRVISGEASYPAMEDVKKWVTALSDGAWFINATGAAMELGNAIFGNIMLIGALSGSGALPLDRKAFETVISQTMPPEKVTVNLSAYDMGVHMVQQ